MPKNPQEFADLLGAKVVGQVPAVGGGPFGMARLARLLHRTLTPSEGERPGRPTNPTWVLRPKVPMSEVTADHLARIAEALSTPERKVSPMQVAAQLLEEAVRRVQAKAEPQEAGAAPPDTTATPSGKDAEPGPRARLGERNQAKRARRRKGA